MRILITNDDGIEAPGIRALAGWARRLGEVTVIAPKTEQSAKSQSIELHKSFEALPRDLFEGIEAWHVDSTPADCIRFGFQGLHRRFDLVFAGINNGLNIGADIPYSGTVGAALEADVEHTPGIAFSTDFGGIDAAASQLDRVWDYFEKRGLLQLHSLYNVNIPPRPAKDILITRQGGMFYCDVFQLVSAGQYKAVGRQNVTRDDSLEKDIDAVLEGYISIMPLTVDRTAHTIYQKLI